MSRTTKSQLADQLAEKEREVSELDARVVAQASEIDHLRKQADEYERELFALEDSQSADAARAARIEEELLVAEATIKILDDFINEVNAAASDEIGGLRAQITYLISILNTIAAYRGEDSTVAQVLSRIAINEFVPIIEQWAAEARETEQDCCGQCE